MNLSTLTLVARDPETGHLAVAGGTNWFCYGRWVPHIEAGVGALATQAETNMWYAREGIKNLAKSMSSQEVIDNVLKRDPDSNGVYQLLVIDNEGKTAGYTGKHNHHFAGYILDDNFGVAGNTLVGKETLEAVQETYLDTTGDFGARIIKALQAGQQAGGDIRGMKSAAMKIASGKSTGKYWNDILVDLRVDENNDPLAELERLYKIDQAYVKVIDAEESHSSEDALQHYLEALELDPGNSEILFWISWTYANLGKTDQSKEYFGKIVDRKKLWQEYRKRLEERGKRI